MNESKASARYYLFEDMLWEMPGFAHLRVPQPMSVLQLYAGLIWARERAQGACPTVGPKRGKDISYYLWPDPGEAGTIRLGRKHQNLGGLLHELAHALGRNDKLKHGPAFRKRCIRLYRIYGDWSGEIDW